MKKYLNFLENKEAFGINYVKWQKAYKSKEDGKQTEHEKHIPMHDGRWLLSDIREDSHIVRNR